ncbi:hypothetical protein K504DRAFT_426988 [Pleomassaria siparia CBS 279.74]|uniref:Wax synthase domain-containing protein n=1 Tax=Pleomassaria siparia CBS 279.74 TaxID=1314801 RepID=A0A6G1KI29_9PLEO|nr:hypothetical protein K504DRAFT_426988 [Pleomassaria siparia CBS 279.74]
MELPPVFLKLQLPLVLSTVIVAQGLKPGILRIFFTLPLLIILASQALYRKESADYGVDYPLQVGVCMAIFIYFDQILLANPDKEKWHKIQYGKQKEVESVKGESGKDGAIPQTFFGRVWWAIRFTTTTRYVGWSQQVKNVPIEVAADYSRWRFLVRKSLRAAFFIVLTDTEKAYTASTVHGGYRGFETGKVPVGLSGYPLFDQFKFTWMHIFITYGILELSNTLYGIVSVASGFANPRECPSLFGSLWGMYTVRKSWGLVWHQQTRRICQTFGLFVARDVLRLRKGSFGSKYVQLFAAFAVSCATHGGAAMLLKKSWSAGNADHVCFFAQAVAIFIEDHVIAIGKSMGFKDSAFWRAVGFVWVVAWFGLSLITYISTSMDNGIWIHEKQWDFFGVGPKV